ncbi:hypothetical protein ACNOYE_00520 [Nannocystaceae bacterium ST9]
MMLGVGIENAQYDLAEVLPHFASGALAEVRDAHAIGVLFRQLGLCKLFSLGSAEPLFVAQMQAVSAYVHRLPALAHDDLVTSWAGVFWDAVGGEYFDAASTIAGHARGTHNRAWEHEDDFLHVWFVMNRYFLGASDDRQRALLDRWEVVLEGAFDPRWLLDDALLRGDDEGFREAFIDVADDREVRLREQVAEGSLTDDIAVWFVPFWAEGLALLRLAERDGLRTDQHCKMVPNVTRRPNPFAYDPEAWRSIEFKPRRR